MITFTTNNIPAHFKYNASVSMGKNFKEVVFKRLIDAHGYMGRPDEPICKRNLNMQLLNEALDRGRLIVTISKTDLVI